MTEDKSELLRSLTIDRSASKAERSKSRWLPISAAIVACVVAFAAFGAYEFRRQDPPKETASQAAQQPAAQPQTAQQPQQPAANTKAAGNLAASGYVVARRKATVAAEITGKVVEVFIDEGMTVTEGQVVARLDSVLAEKDYELARSRAETADAAIAAITADLRRREPDHDANTHALAEEFRHRGRSDQGAGPGRRAQRAIAPGASRNSRPPGSTRSAAPRCSTSIKSGRRSPASSIDRSAQPGEMISPMSVGGYTRTGICTIVDMDSIEIEVDVNEAFIGRVVPGGAVNAMLDAYPDWTIPASVIAIVPTANREKATVKVRIRFEKKDPRILPDMAVKVNFLADAKAKGATETTAAN